MPKYFPKGAEEDEIKAEIYRGKEMFSSLDNSYMGERKFAVFCGANNETNFFKSEKEAITFRNELFAKWHGTGIYPHIILLEAKELSTVF